jgi:hypothetical protein
MVHIQCAGQSAEIYRKTGNLVPRANYCFGRATRSTALRVTWRGRNPEEMLEHPGEDDEHGRAILVVRSPRPVMHQNIPMVAASPKWTWNCWFVTEEEM